MKGVIIAGGSGTRLWPMSRTSYPKQFLSLCENQTMLQATIQRLSNLPLESTVTICNEAHRFLVAEQLREVGGLGTILLEPIGKNTAPAVALAALSSAEDSLLLVLAADHIIADKEEFTRSIQKAIPLAEEGKLVAFGIVPTEAHTGYGYIEAGCPMGAGRAIKSFTEKPDIDTAKEYLKNQDYYWNSGMFLFKCSSYKKELRKFRPTIFEVCSKAISAIEPDLDFCRIPEHIFSECPDESIDHAVFENTSDAVMIPMDAGWSDVGSWDSLWAVSKKDAEGNVVYGDVILESTKNSIVHSDDKLVATIGVDDMVIVSTKDALLVSHKNQVEQTKRVVAQLKLDGRDEWKSHREVHRPWGKYDTVDTGSRHLVKRISVNPGAKLSVQIHHHRAEHWVVVSGTAIVRIGTDTFMLKENESTYIPIGSIHSLENPGETTLQIIEIQTGTYLSEDDIIRVEDRYGRSKK